MSQTTIFALPPVSISPPAGNLESFRAELIEEGTYKHPTLGFTVRATKDKLTRWADVFKKMLAAGRQVTLPPGHEARFQPDKNFGHVEEITVEKKANGKHALFGKLLVPIADMAAKVGTTIKAVSIGIADKIVDGFGEWEDCIDHVAFTNDPVATTAGNFQVALDAEAEIEWRILPMSAVGMAAAGRATPIFHAGSKNVTDNQDHFPIDTIARAHNALARAAQVVARLGKPTWWTGTAKQFLDTVRRAVKAKYPSIAVGGLAADALNATTDLGAVADKFAERRASDAVFYLSDVLRDLFGDEGLTAEERKATFDEAVADVQDIAGAALLGTLAETQDIQGAAAALGLDLEGMEVDLKTLRETLGLGEAVADEAVLTKACEEIASLRKTRDEATQKLSALEAPAPKTQREKDLELKVLETRMEGARDRADSDAVVIKSALDAGKFSAKAADIMRKLLGVRTASAMNLSTGADEAMDVRQLARELIAETREKAAVAIGEITKGLSLVSGGGGPNFDATRLTVDEVKKADIRSLSALTGEELVGLDASVREAIYDRLSGKN